MSEPQSSSTSLLPALGPSEPSGGRFSDAPEAQTRTCGTCRVCCKLPNLPEINKPLDTWCRYVNRDRASERGCTAYGTPDRPRVCADFQCGWLLGLGEHLDRPDRLGVLMQPTLRGQTERVLTFVEYRPGALAEPRAQQLLDMWATRNDGVVIVRKYGAPAFMQVPITINRITVVDGLRNRLGHSPAAR